MLERLGGSVRPGIRLGAVTYLNARPLVHALAELAPEAEIVFDLPSRLADALAAGRLDVALVPSIEYARRPQYAVVSDACVACDGPARSVMFYSRVPVERIETLALDEGSRTSAALAQILLRERLGIEPRLQALPIGVGLEDSMADATMLIGDRGMRPVGRDYAAVWDLGEEWSRWTGLPFVFAMWIGLREADLTGLARLLSAARDVGVARREEIARQASVELGLPEADCLAYLRDNLQFRLGSRQRRGLSRFYELAARHGLAPAGVELEFHGQPAAR
jgi:chorismate dehydratase